MTKGSDWTIALIDYRFTTNHKLEGRWDRGIGVFLDIRLHTAEKNTGTPKKSPLGQSRLLPDGPVLPLGINWGNQKNHKTGCVAMFKLTFSESNNCFGVRFWIRHSRGDMWWRFWGCYEINMSNGVNGDQLHQKNCLRLRSEMQAFVLDWGMWDLAIGSVGQLLALTIGKCEFCFFW